MKLYIRSQDKKDLVQVKSLSVCEYIPISELDGEKIDEVPKWGVECNYCWLGIYETEQRCLEILDEIQKIMNVDPMGLLLANDCRIGEDCYKGVVKQFKENGLGAICIDDLGLHNARIQYIPKNFIVYEMPKE